MTFANYPTTALTVDGMYKVIEHLTQGAPLVTDVTLSEDVAAQLFRQAKQAPAETSLFDDGLLIHVDPELPAQSWHKGKPLRADSPSLAMQGKAGAFELKDAAGGQTQGPSPEDLAALREHIKRAFEMTEEEADAAMQNLCVC
jgi:hypothetical protein